MMAKVIDQLAIFDDAEIDECVLQVARAKNSNFRRHGRSPFQAALGRIPRLATALLSDESQATVWTSASAGTAIARAEAMRVDANKAFFDVEANQEIR